VRWSTRFDRRFEAPHVPSWTGDNSARVKFDLGQGRKIAFDNLVEDRVLQELFIY
jgi:hypothetical protein